MKLNKDFIRQQFLPEDFSEGEKYYSKGNVKNLKAESIHCGIMLSAAVRDGEKIRYQVTAELSVNGLHWFCECPHFKEGRYCKHIAAVLCAYMDNPPIITAAKKEPLPDRPPQTQSDGTKLLQYYLNNAQIPMKTPTPIRLVPKLLLNGNNYPDFQFTLGCERQYVLRNINSFVERIYKKELYSYGKYLTFYHAIENFDETSQELIRILTAKFSHPFQNGYYSEENSDDDSYTVQFTGEQFDRIFNLLCNTSVLCDTEPETLLFCEGNPKVMLDLQKAENGATLRASSAEPLDFFGDNIHLYAVSTDRIMRCSSEFQEKVYPLLHICREGLFFSQSDLPTLCDCVLSDADELAEVHDKDNLLSEYMPEQCIPCYYLDMDTALGLICRLKWRYDEKLIDKKTPPEECSTVKRNERKEQESISLLEQYFLFDDSENRFYIADKDKMITFLTSDIKLLQENGTVYISESLRKKRVHTTRLPVVGLSVSKGLLTLNMETDDFPPKELEALYQSLISKKKYYILEDGRYLPLDGSGYEKLAELAHMTQLSAEELRSGKAELPVYRGLYLDRVLGQTENLTVNKSEDFRKLVRAFKSVEDSEFDVPNELCATLRPYQRVGFQWLKTLEENGFGGILADEMGLGKTIQILALLLTAPRSKTEKPSLIVCPTSLILNWLDEAKRFAPSLTPLIIMGTAAERARQIANDTTADFWITSYDLIKRDIEQYKDKQFYFCILDEGQYIKNQSTLVSQAVKQIVCEHRFVLTGTPVENRLSELWNLFDFLMPGYLFSHSTFLERLEKPIIRSGDSSAQRQLNLLVQPFMLRRLKKDVLPELPPKTEHIHRICLSPEERRVYSAAALIAQKKAAVAERKPEILALLTKLRQICCDPSLCFENYSGEHSKLAACTELCTSLTINGHQILLFSQFTTMLEAIKEQLEQLGISCFTLEGSTPKEERARLVRLFNKGGASVFLISLKAGGTGLNLTSADVVIHYDPWWNMAVQNQATDRAHRIGQQCSVQVYKLIAENTIEEKILQLQEKKASLMDALNGTVGSAPLTREEILDLLAYNVAVPENAEI